MDTILPLLRTIARKRQPSPTPERRPPSQRSHGDKHTAEIIEALVFILARKGMEYAAKRYLASDHGTTRRKEGAPAVDVEALERLGRVILERFMGKDDERKGRRRDEQRPPRDEKREPRERGHGKGDRHEKTRGHGSRRHGEDQGEKQRRKHRDASSESRSRHRRQYGKSHGRKHDTHHHDQQDPKRKHRRRHRRPELELDDLRTRLEDMSEALIGMNERPAGRAGHEECEYYNLFVAASTPLQDAIGGVLGQMREVDGKKGRGRRRHGGGENKERHEREVQEPEAKPRRKREVEEPEVSRGRTRRRREYRQ